MLALIAVIRELESRIVSNQ